MVSIVSRALAAARAAARAKKARAKPGISPFATSPFFTPSRPVSRAPSPAPPRQFWGTSSERYGQVSPAGRVEITPTAPADPGRPTGFVSPEGIAIKLPPKGTVLPEMEVSQRIDDVWRPVPSARAPPVFDLVRDPYDVSQETARYITRQEAERISAERAYEFEERLHRLPSAIEKFGEKVYEVSEKLPFIRERRAFEKELGIADISKDVQMGVVLGAPMFIARLPSVAYEFGKSFAEADPLRLPRMMGEEFARRPFRVVGEMIGAGLVFGAAGALRAKPPRVSLAVEYGKMTKLSKITGKIESDFSIKVSKIGKPGKPGKLLKTEIVGEAETLFEIAPTDKLVPTRAWTIAKTGELAKVKVGKKLELPVMKGKLSLIHI